MTIVVELPIEDGELVCRALDKGVEVHASNGPEFAGATWQGQQADALVAMARTYLSGDATARSGSADHYQVIVHVDEVALAEGRGRSDLPVETVRRLGCDGSVVPILENGEGVLSVDRKRRTVSAAIKRALWARDGGCSFPGCTHVLFLDAHHIRHWSQGGETSLDNTMLLCPAHHRLAHEGDYTIRRDERNRWYFCRPDGRAIPDHGYQSEDVTDELHPPAGVYASQEDRLSAERREYDGVRELRGRYVISELRLAG